ncbi:hypothetical protein [Leifsonia sp. Leaf336]|uniref:hypothetical protein n=1 Tax=Leifsonia sp. Leaf336 TaxID=1736341 RepID=UPI000AF55266|nr:hypothetical protein [Leifsonia sp. Leaf336]
MNRSTYWHQFSERSYKLVIAGMTLLAGALGVWAGVVTANNAQNDAERRNLNGEVTELTQRLEQSERDREARNLRIGALEAELDKLRSAVPPSVDLTADHKIRASRNLTLARNGDAIDLNSVSETLNAGKVAKYSTDSLAFDGKNLLIGGFTGVSYVALETPPASYAVCKSQTAYRHITEIEPHLLSASNTCTRLASGRYVSILAANWNDGSVDLTMVIWE